MPAEAIVMRTVGCARLVLEPQIAAHADELYAVLGDPALYAYEGEPPASAQWLRERFGRLETRRSADGSEAWLNWVVRLADGPAIGFVQATVYADGDAAVAYVIGSAWWGRGLASEAVQAMLQELTARHGAGPLHAVFKRDNLRSRRLLQRLGFVPAPARRLAAATLEPDEAMMCRDPAADLPDLPP